MRIKEQELNLKEKKQFKKDDEIDIKEQYLKLREQKIELIEKVQKQKGMHHWHIKCIWH